MVVTEQTAVTLAGRSTTQDLGIWADGHTDSLRPLTEFIKAQGSVPGIQVGHSGAKGSVRRPWDPRTPLTADEGAWQPVSPSGIPFGADRPTPKILSASEIDDIVVAFGEAARRADDAGFDFLQIHGGHGYLIHQFLSPLTNQRDDNYGGSLEDRSRFAIEVVESIRAYWPAEKPLGIRLSVFDGDEQGWQMEDTLQLIPRLEDAGVDIVDASLGGIASGFTWPSEPGFHVPAAERIRADTGVVTAAGWKIAEPQLADDVIRSGAADLVTIARTSLQDPHWPLRAAHTLGIDAEWPEPYQRGRWDA